MRTRSSSRAFSASSTPSSDDEDNHIDSPDDGSVANTCAEPEPLPVPAPCFPFPALPDGLDSQHELVLGYIASALHKGINHLGDGLNFIGGKVDLTNIKLDAFADFEYEGFRASWFKSFLDVSTIEDRDSYVLVNKLRNPFRDWVDSHPDPAVKTWRREHSQERSSKPFMANDRSINKFILELVKYLDTEDRTLVKYRSVTDHQKHVLLSRTLK
ncbi:hypothetical protein HKX48_003294, partial [Thoreauomyces humboldtii]